MRVIFLGHNSYYTVTNLARAIKEYTTDIKISVADIIKPDGENVNGDEAIVFDEILTLPKKRDTDFNSGDRRETTFEIIKDKSKRKHLLKRIFALRLKSARKYIDGETEERIFSSKMKQVLEKYDVFHFHYPTQEFIAPLDYIGNRKKTIFTIWGSDLLQESGVENYKRQYEAFNCADYITINTSEMKEIFLSKFGRQFSPKIRQAYFILNEEQFKEIDSNNNNETLSKFKKKHNIPFDKRIITIGYSASAKQRHLEILNVLSQLDNNIKNKIHVVIPLTYGLQFETGEYLEKIRSVCNNADYTTTVLTEYMTGMELIEFTVASEIKLNLRESDSMNAALIESLIAGNIVVNGAWLPYGKLRRLGVYCHEIETFEELKQLIPELVNNFEIEKRKTSKNSEILRKFFSVDNIVKDWVKLFNEIKIQIQN